MLSSLNRGDLSFCVTVVTFKGYRSFRLCKTMTLQAVLVVVVISCPLIFFQHSQLKWPRFHPDRKNTYVLFNFTFFSFCFLLIFFHFHCNLQLIYTLGFYFCSVVLSVTKHTFFIRCQGPLFSWCRPRGAQNASVVQISLVQKCFSIFCFFFRVGFLGGPMCLIHIK